MTRSHEVHVRPRSQNRSRRIRDAVRGAMLLLALSCSPHESAGDVVHTGCENGADCPGGRCVQGFPGGLCTRDYTAQEDCPDGTVCADTESLDGVCLFVCSTDGACVDRLGPGYTCDTETNLSTGEDVLVCVDA